MQLSQIVTKPQLIEVTLRNVELPIQKDGHYVMIEKEIQKLNHEGKKLFMKTLEGPDGRLTKTVTTEKTDEPIMRRKGSRDTYYEPEVTFYTPDRHPMHDYLQLSLNLNKGQDASVELLQKLILDKEGNTIIKEGAVPPINVQVLAMAEVMALLGE